MRVHAIRTRDELQAAMTFVRTTHPSPPRDEGYYQRRYADESPLMMVGEDSGGICAVMLGFVDAAGVVQVDDYVAKDAVSFSMHARLLDAVAQGADLMRLRMLFVPALQRAEVYEEMGCVPMLHVQLGGDNVVRTRAELIRRLRGTHRALGVGRYGPAVYAQFGVERVDHAFLREIEASTPGAQGAIWLMYRWVGEEGGVLSDGTVHYRRPRYVVTFHPRFKRSALAEVKDVDSATSGQPLSAPDVVVIPSAIPGRDLAPAFRADPPAFVRHLAPVQIVVPLRGDLSDLDLLAGVAQRLPVDPACSFAVQCRKGRVTLAGRYGTASYTSRDVEVCVGSAFDAPFDPDHPEQVLSVYLDGELAYLGLSDVGDNLTTHADEARRRSTWPTKISRAEHKLLEAIETFGLVLTPGQRALDLGAAPGGWSLVLAEAGLQVTAVDPAALSPEVNAHPLVTHIRSRAECTDLMDERYDLVVDDMSIGPDESAAILCDIAPALAEGTPVVLTIKLPTLNVRRWLEETTAVIEGTYRIEGLRHLYHNRQEVTALLRRVAGGE